MISVYCNDTSALMLLRKVYANKLVGAGTPYQRMRVNKALKAFKEALLLTSVVAGEPVKGKAVVLYEWCLARIDIDAPTKAVQDALQGVLFEGGDDRVVRCSLTLLSRPSETREAPHIYARAFGDGDGDRLFAFMGAALDVACDDLSPRQPGVE